MKIKVYTLNAFASEPHGGNPAGVVLDADDLSKEEMLKIATKVGFSETAFVSKSKVADFKVRFFTPSEEVDLCGHATIATFFLLKEKNILSAGVYVQETKAGVLNVEITESGKVLMNQANPEYFGELERQEIADSLNISVDLIMDSLPIEIVSTGLRDILIPIKSLSDLLAIKPNFQKVLEVSKKHEVVGYHLFSLETQFESIAHTRNLAPLYDIDEESATGTSNGGLSCYLFKHKILNEKEVQNIVLEQGYCMNLPSKISVSLSTKGDKIMAVKVGGKALNIQEKEFNI